MSKTQETRSSSEVSEGPTTVKIYEATQLVTSTPDCGNVQSAASAPRLSPSSSMNSLNSENSTLNPHAKEFKFNPNAKSFVPLQFPYGNLFCPTPACYVWSLDDLISITTAIFPVKYPTIWAADASWSTPTDDVHARLSPGVGGGCVG
ncbi:polyadenylate-binding protein-interacting protein 3 [Artemisia annua]|uniref:Polyadenylate-binding protein-interacting protein 3 n=1 Tax=Artemisia annua TaxID=35608 RepID=A0A2U1LDB9_ARTAN|nr:polyadenylate-binding protein-interacting protein 3 [Artemisia annua]